MQSTILHRPAVGFALAALVATMLATSAGPADAATVDRINGENRYDTGAKVSQYTFTNPDDVTTVYVATGRDFPDALAAGAAASALPGPVILTDPGALVDEARDELRRLQPDEVILVGGEIALSKAVESAIKGDSQIGATVRRIAGENRFDTAAKVTIDAFPDGVEKIFVATGRGFPDALAGVPAAARFGTGLLLVEKDTLPEETAAALTTLGVKEVIILGGSTVVSFTVADAIDDLVEDVDRIAGENRFDTAAQASANAFRGGARTVFLATGRSFPDALTGGPAAAVFGGPLLLTEKDTLPEETAIELQALNPRLVVILGGESAVDNAVRAQIDAALEGSSALPSGATPEFAFSIVDNRDGPRRGLQAISVGTFAGDFETISNPTADERDNGPIFNNQGTRVAFRRSNRTDDFSAEPTIHVTDVARGAGSTRELIDLNTFEFGCGYGGSFWTPAGDELVLLCADRTDDKGDDDTSNDEDLPNILYTVDLRGNTAEIPTVSDTAYYIAGTAATTGTEVALSSFDPDAEARFRVVTVDLDDVAAAPATVVVTEDPYYELHWSSDGATMAASAITGSAFLGRPDGNIAVINVEAGTTALLLPAEGEGQFVASGITPDGSSVLVQALTFDAEAQTGDSILTIDAGTGDVRTVVNTDELENVWISQLAFVSGGTRILFDDLSASGTSVGRPSSADAGVIASIAVDGSDRTNVVDVADVIVANPSPTKAVAGR